MIEDALPTIDAVSPDERLPLLMLTVSDGNPIYDPEYDPTKSSQTLVNWLTAVQAARLNLPSTRDVLGHSAPTTAHDAALALICLAEWDSQFIERKIYSGNVYLASTEALRNLLLICQIHLDSVLDNLVRCLAELQLIYRFPIAKKFQNEYSGEQQLRCNGWGRSAASQVSVWLPEESTRARKMINSHLDKHEGEYREALQGVADLVDRSSRRARIASEHLPVEVLF